MGWWLAGGCYLCSQPEFQNLFFRVLKGSHFSVGILLLYLPLPSSLWQYKPTCVISTETRCRLLESIVLTEPHP